MLLGLFLAIIWAGHVPIMFMILGIQIAMAKELFGICRGVREQRLPGFRALQWYTFAVATFWVYSRFIARNLTVELSAHARLAAGVGWLLVHLEPLCFSLYCAGFVAFVLSLRKGSYRYQFSQFAWTHMIMLVVVVPSSFLVSNVFDGLIWVLLPAALVIANDTAAYLAGMLFGKTPLISISPKKTWEGFIGGLLLTTLCSWHLAGAMSSSRWLTCRRPDLSIIQPLDCDSAPPIYRARDYSIDDIWTRAWNAIAGEPTLAYADDAHIASLSSKAHDGTESGAGNGNGAGAGAGLFSSPSASSSPSSSSPSLRYTVARSVRSSLESAGAASVSRVASFSPVAHLLCRGAPAGEACAAVLRDSLSRWRIRACPMQLHAIVLSVFASLIAPFGGFFASGFKRGLKIKDFGDSIPGHGGMTDRMDCQVVMAVFSYIYLNSYVLRRGPGVADVVAGVAGLSPREQLEALERIANILVGSKAIPDSLGEAIAAQVHRAVAAGGGIAAHAVARGGELAAHAVAKGSDMAAHAVATAAAARRAVGEAVAGNA